MSKGWREVARLGGAGARYPHVLADAHGWCLRFGRNARTDEKYYSSLPVLLQGLVGHLTRRRLLALSAPLDLAELCREVRDALHTALGLCHETLAKGGMEEHVRRSGRPNYVSTSLVALSDPPSWQSGKQANPEWRECRPV